MKPAVFAILLTAMVSVCNAKALANCSDLSRYTQAAIEAMKQRAAMNAAERSMHDLEENTNATAEALKEAQHEPCANSNTIRDYYLAAAWFLSQRVVGLYAMESAGKYADLDEQCRPIAQAFAQKGLSEEWYYLWLASKRKPRNEYFRKVNAMVTEDAAALAVTLPLFTAPRAMADSFSQRYDADYNRIAGALENLRAQQSLFSRAPCGLYDAIPNYTYQGND